MSKKFINIGDKLCLKTESIDAMVVEYDICKITFVLKSGKEIYTKASLDTFHELVEKVMECLGTSSKEAL